MLKIHSILAKQFILSGHVQGVGFRPFVYRLAGQYGVQGWVENRLGQVAIHAEAKDKQLADFQRHLITHAPKHSNPVISEWRRVAPENYQSFCIRKSNALTVNAIQLVPDLPLCQDCIQELLDPQDRRHYYPFINCTDCGPRYTLVRKLPYDRINTTMADFPLCPHCQNEYDNPMQRRFHAEALACPQCGPRLQFVSDSGAPTEEQRALQDCVAALVAGKIIAIKGVGGYHLMCDACNDHAVQMLRQRKPRPHKPLAIMMLQQHLKHHVQVNVAAQELLDSTVHPIVLLPKTGSSFLSHHIAPGLEEIGVMKPYSPLHYLILKLFDRPIVASSANISGEPVMTDNDAVQQRLAAVADVFLHHNRSIQRPADDPVYRFIDCKARPLRLGRGNAPLELSLPFNVQQPTLAVGGHMKNTVALAWDRRLVVSPHIGQLDSPRSMDVFVQVIEDMQTLYRVRAQRVIHDAHPDYASSRWALRSGVPSMGIYHHQAHAACLAGEYPLEPQWLVFTWDGSGLGEDHTLWGGEALLGGFSGWRRVASIRPFFLPGGDKAARQPWRSAAALCWEIGISWHRKQYSSELLQRAWSKKIHCPQSSAVGRLFDAAAALLGILDMASYEGQGPMLLEALALRGSGKVVSLPTERVQRDVQANVGDTHLLQTNWEPLLAMLMDKSLSLENRARSFQDSMAQALLQQALHIREEHGDFAVGLCGGVFQNRLLCETVLKLLRQHHFRCYLPESVPVNDAGLCYGQIIAAHGLVASI